jgi:hypothetical protein
MGLHDSYQETFRSWTVTTKETGVRGREHCGGFRIGHEVSHGVKVRDQVNFQYTMGGSGIDTSMKTVDRHGLTALTVRLRATVAMEMRH